MVQLELWQMVLIIIASAFCGRYLLTTFSRSPDLRAIRRQIQDTHNASEWISVGALTDMLTQLHRGERVDVANMLDNSRIQYAHLNQFSQNDIARILEDLDMQAIEPRTNPFDDQEEPNQARETAALIRVLFAERQMKEAPPLSAFVASIGEQQKEEVNG